MAGVAEVCKRQAGDYVCTLLLASGSRHEAIKLTAGTVQPSQAEGELVSAARCWLESSWSSCEGPPLPVRGQIDMASTMPSARMLLHLTLSESRSSSRHAVQARQGQRHLVYSLLKTLQAEYQPGRHQTRFIAAHARHTQLGMSQGVWAGTP